MSWKSMTKVLYRYGKDPLRNLTRNLWGLYTCITRNWSNWSTRRSVMKRWLIEWITIGINLSRVSKARRVWMLVKLIAVACLAMLTLETQARLVKLEFRIFRTWTQTNSRLKTFSNKRSKLESHNQFRKLLNPSLISLSHQVKRHRAKLFNLTSSWISNNNHKLKDRLEQS